MTAQFHFRTDAFAPHERAEAFEAAFTAIGCSHGFGRIETQPEGTLSARYIGPLSTVSLRCSNAPLRRTKQHAAETPHDGIIVVDHLSYDPISWRTSRKTWVDLRPGEMVVGPTNEVYECFPDGVIHYDGWRLPLELLRQVGVGYTTFEEGLRLPEENAMASMALTYLRELGRQSSRLDEDELNESALIAARLVALAGGTVNRDEPFMEAGRAGQLVMLKRRIRERLHDPLLSPTRIAADFCISVRKLHLLFEAGGETFTQFVASNRLAAAQTLLTNPHYRRRSIADVAFSLGFNSLATFYRTYRLAFGETPGDTRERLAARDWQLWDSR